MSKRKVFTRNKMKAFLNVLKDELQIEYNTRDITNMAGCKVALKEIVDIYMSNRVFSVSLGELDTRYDALRSENIFLKSQIEELKNKKWWKFWR